MFCEDEVIEDCNDETLDGMNAVGACQRIEEKATQIEDVLLDGIDAALAAASVPAYIIKKAFDLLSPSVESEQTILTNSNIDLDTDFIASQFAACENRNTISQTNSISIGSPACILAWSKAGWTPEQIAQITGPTVVSNVEQTNTAEVVGDCQVSVLLDALSKMEASIDNAALQQAINSAINMGDAESKQDVCSDLNVSMSACKYIKQSQCCANNSVVNQLNEIPGGCFGGNWSEIKQTNQAAIYSNCQMSGNSSISDSLAGSIFNTTGQDATNTAEGMDLTALVFAIIIILGIVLAAVAGVVIVPTIAVGSIGKKVINVLGILLLLSGLGSFIYFLWTIKPKITRFDKPFTLCEKTVRSGDKERVKFSEVDQSAYGYDFFPDDIEKDPSEIEEDDKGLVVYLSKVDRNDNNCTPIDDTKERCRSHLSSWTDTNVMLLSVGLAIAGVLVILSKKTQQEKKSRCSSSP